MAEKLWEIKGVSKNFPYRRYDSRQKSWSQSMMFRSPSTMTSRLFSPSSANPAAEKSTLCKMVLRLHRPDMR